MKKPGATVGARHLTPGIRSEVTDDGDGGAYANNPPWPKQATSQPDTR
jgi:hypothetical protein